MTQPTWNKSNEWYNVQTMMNRGCVISTRLMHSQSKGAIKMIRPIPVRSTFLCHHTVRSYFKPSDSMVFPTRKIILQYCFRDFLSIFHVFHLLAHSFMSYCPCPFDSRLNEAAHANTNIDTKISKIYSLQANIEHTWNAWIGRTLAWRCSVYLWLSCNRCHCQSEMKTIRLLERFVNESNNQGFAIAYAYVLCTVMWSISDDKFQLNAHVWNELFFHFGCIRWITLCNCKRIALNQTICKLGPWNFYFNSNWKVIG